ncbi:MAG: DbpA RNA binding domain-containing protein [Deltaproteobacteria bacterium]|nr:DbpA RNA binding domain-containing protein [Deltaproteobacteria bacterium]
MNNTLNQTNNSEAKADTNFDSNNNGKQANTECQANANEAAVNRGSENNSSTFKPNTEIPHFVCDVSADISAKREALLNLIGINNTKFCLVYCDGRSDIEFVEAVLRRNAINARRLSSSLPDFILKKLPAKLEADRIQVLVSSEQNLNCVLNKSVDLIINYSLPENSDIYEKRLSVLQQSSTNTSVITFVSPKEFSVFHAVKRTLEYNFAEYTLPDNGAIIQAKLARLQNITANSNELKAEDKSLAAAFLSSRLGSITVASEVTDLFATLLRSVVEKQLTARTVSLEEELDIQNLDYPQEDFNSDRRHNRRDDHERRDRFSDRSGHQEDRRDHHHDRHSARSDHYGRDGRERHDRHERDRSYRDNDRGDSRHHSRDRRGYRNDSRSTDWYSRSRDHAPRKDEVSELRLYIGQGTSHGMNEELFIQLAENMGEIKKEDIRHISIREHYGFVDLIEDKAKQLINNLNGIEYNGVSLLVQKATTLGRRKGQDKPQQVD